MAAASASMVISTALGGASKSTNNISIAISHSNSGSLAVSASSQNSSGGMYASGLPIRTHGLPLKLNEQLHRPTDSRSILTALVEARTVLAIYDCMSWIKPKVGTVCFGAASQGAVLVGGEKGMHYAMPNARILIHQPQS